MMILKKSFSLLPASIMLIALGALCILVISIKFEAPIYFISVFIPVWCLIFGGFSHFKAPVRYAIIGLTINVLATYANASLDSLTFGISFNALALSLAFVGLLVLTQSLNINHHLKSAISTALTLTVFIVLLFYSGNYLLFKAPVSYETIHALWQSNASEVIEFIQSYLSLWVFVVFVIAILIVWRVFSFSATKKARPPATILGITLLVPIFVALPQQSSLNPMLKVLVKGTLDYFQELDEYKEWRELRKDALLLTGAKLNNKEQTVVVLLGESVNKHHMSLYGYPRDTTPNIDILFSDNDIIKFQNSYASHTHTGPAIAYALTQANHYTASNWKNAASILDLSKYLGYETSWITNQQTFGAWDNQVSILAENASIVISKNKNIGTYKEADKYDEILLPSLAETLNNNSKNKLIFVHLQGSHLWYCNRFPGAHNPFNDHPFLKSIFGALESASQSDQDRINCYDNSIYYTDHIIKKIIGLLENQKQPASLLYLADHADDALKGIGHNKDAFTYDMIEIPMFFWANKNWKTSFTDRWKNLSINSDKVFTNDHLFETLSGVLGIESEQIDSRYNLSSADFIPVEQPLTLLGQINIDSKENWRYWQRVNAKQITFEQQCLKLLPHRANTIGKIKSILESGLCGFEIDVLFNSSINSSFFDVGHDIGTLTNTSLDEILAAINFDHVGKIWLDIKNVDKEKIPQIVNRLDYLNKKYQLKSKTVVETSYFGEQVDLLSSTGYELSYYLPTTAVLETNSQSENEKMRLAKELLERIESMKPKAISFDLRLYSFVKKYLELAISEDIEYHTWFPDDFDFSTPNVTRELANQNYFSDPRVKTILMTYYSPFNY